MTTPDTTTVRITCWWYSVDQPQPVRLRTRFGITKTLTRTTRFQIRGLFPDGVYYGNWLWRYHPHTTKLAKGQIPGEFVQISGTLSQNLLDQITAFADATSESIEPNFQVCGLIAKWHKSFGQTYDIYRQPCDKNCSRSDSFDALTFRLEDEIVKQNTNLQEKLRKIY